MTLLISQQLSLLLALLLVNSSGNADALNLPELSHSPITFGSFNVQNFGLSKFKKEDVVYNILKVMKRYDLLSFIEIVDKKEKFFPALVEKFNENAKTADRLSYVISKRLGRSSGKEQYAFLYKASKMRILDTYQYPESKDQFERPPFAVKVGLFNATISEVVFMTIHTKPEEANAEMQHLYNAYLAVKAKWKINDIAIMGDFNSDCSYMSPMDLSELKLSNSKRFSWLITRCAGTSMLRTHCIYDHIVVAGEKLRAAIPTNSARVFRFDEAYNLNQTLAVMVSDHYPVQATINGKVKKSLASKMSTAWSFTIVQPVEDSNLNSVRAIYRAMNDKTQNQAGYEIQLLKQDSAMHHVESVSHNVTDVMASLEAFHAAFPGVLEARSLALVRDHLKTKFFNTLPQVSGYSHKDGNRKMEVKINCQLKSPLACSIKVTSITYQGN